MKRRTLLTVVLVVLVSGIALVGGIILGRSGQSGKQERKKVERDKESESDSEETAKPEVPSTIILYFTDEKATYLIPEKRRVSRSEATPQKAIEELVKGPSETGHIRTLPEGVKLLSLEVKGGTAYVNFNQTFKNDYLLGSAAETLVLYSVVNTATEFPSIRQVKFLVDGKPLQVEGSNYDLAQPFSRDEGKIKH